MIKLFKLLKWDLQSKIGRFLYVYFFLQNFPGNLGSELRSRFIRKYLKSVGSNFVVHVGFMVRNPDRLVLGDNVTLGVNNFIQAAGDVIIGDNVLFGPDVKIWSANHVFADPSKPIAGQGYEYKKVTIGSNVWIGANAFIMPGAEIGDGCVISAGSVVSGKSVPPLTILAGNPARKIGSRAN